MLKKIVRLLWSLQPRPLRRLELDAVELLMTRPLPKKRNFEKGDIVVCGMLGTASGIGLAARQTFEAMKARGLAVCGANASRFAVLEDFDAGPLWPEKATEGGLAIVYINPDILSLVWNALGRRRFIKRRVVGVWFWELETVPPRWRRSIPLVDEIWASSHFVANAIRKIAGDKPVHVVPQPFDVSAVRMTPHHDPLPAYAGKTIVFFTYDVRSLHARKNPEAVIDAFRRAAADNPDALLIVKINNAHTWPEAEARVRQAAEGLTNFVLLKKMFSDDEMQDLMARVDIVMSLHRSEGFGLLMASAMAAAKPVIATGWSANTDFMTPDCSVLVDYNLIPVIDPQHIYDKYDAVWAEPDTIQAAEALRRLLADPALRHQMGQAARRQVETFFSKEAWEKALPPSFWEAQA